METDILSGVSKTPSGVAPNRPDGARRLFTTAANVDKLLTNTLVVSTPACVHGRVETSQIGIYVDHRFTWRCLFNVHSSLSPTLRTDQSMKRELTPPT